jgi:hypothetical protein
MIQQRTIVAGAVAVLALAITPLALGKVDTFTDSWTNEPTEFFAPNPCVKKQATGTGVESGTAQGVITPNGSVHVRVETHGTVAFYEALGPGPWDPQPGAYIGTWTYNGKISDQAPPDQSGALTGTSHGPFVLADGRTVMMSSQFHLTFDKGGIGPPKVFFAHFECAGSGQFDGG